MKHDLEVFDKINAWAKERGIYAKGDSKTQFVKLIEESGELARAIIKRDDDEVYDAIGDMVVVLVNLIELYENERLYIAEDNPTHEKVNIEVCINDAYAVIANRRGKMENGTFKKDA